MYYVLRASATRRVLSIVFAATGALAWASLAAACVDDGQRLLAAGGAALAVVVACMCEWRLSARREPGGIRLMGAHYAILDYRMARRGRGAPGASCGVAVAIDRITHWPGRLASVRFVPRVPAPGAGGATDVLIFADALPEPDFRSLGIHLRCIARGVTLVEHR